MKAYFLETERLCFSLWNENDFELAMALWSDPAVTKYISETGIFDNRKIRERLSQEIDNQAKYGIQYWPLFCKPNSSFIGCCGLRPYDNDKEIYELGFHLKSSCWGKGYGTEAAFAVIEYAYDSLGANGLFAGHNPKNQASANVLKKLGFVYSHDELYPPTGLYHPSYYHCR